MAVQWLAPLGLFRFSLGVPLNAKRSDGITTWGDETEGFQFSVGQGFLKGLERKATSRSRSTRY